MSRPTPHDHTAEQLQALADSAKKAMENLQSASLGLAALSKGPKFLTVKESGTIDKAMRIVLKFSNDAFYELQNIRTGAISRTSDTARPNPGKNGKQREANRTPKDKGNSTQVVA